MKERFAASLGFGADRLRRRDFIRMVGLVGAVGMLGGSVISAVAQELIRLPFVNGSRRMARFPQKRELIVLRTRPPLLETPMAIFDRGAFTPNDAFYVRWHLSDIPTDIDVGKFRLRIHGNVKKPVELTLDQIQNSLPAVELAAVNQCSGNSRGFFSPRVAGGQWGNGAMGNALWTGVRLRDLLDRAGVKAGSIQIRFNGMDSGNIPDTPDFMKSLDLRHAMDGEVMVAYGMNGRALPVLNGFPLRLIVPGWYATYWVKMLNDIEVLDHADDNFWMKSAYLIPATPGANVKPGQAVRMVPINRMVPRSFITNLRDNATVRRGVPAEVRGIAFGGDTGVKGVAFSADGGTSWQNATLGEDHGRYSFRRWHTRLVPKQAGTYKLMVNATNSNNLSQPPTAPWNPGGFMRNVVEEVTVHTA
jgi:DMSO/TMAO reductase YedYZ molybdopterin-dependent catalytic subunit